MHRTNSNYGLPYLAFKCHFLITSIYNIEFPFNAKVINMRRMLSCNIFFFRWDASGEHEPKPSQTTWLPLNQLFD